METINKYLNAFLGVSLMLAMGAIIFTIIRTNNIGNNDVIKELNSKYVFVYPYSTNVPFDVNLCAEKVELGYEKDTIYLMPDLNQSSY